MKCTTNNYHWGKLGNESTVADLAKAQGEDISVDTPYAEVIRYTQEYTQEGFKRQFSQYQHSMSSPVTETQHQGGHYSFQS